MSEKPDERLYLIRRWCKGEYHLHTNLLKLNDYLPLPTSYERVYYIFITLAFTYKSGRTRRPMLLKESRIFTKDGSKLVKNVKSLQAFVFNMYHTMASVANTVPYNTLLIKTDVWNIIMARLYASTALMIQADMNVCRFTFSWKTFSTLFKLAIHSVCGAPPISSPLSPLSSMTISLASISLSSFRVYFDTTTCDALLFGHLFQFCDRPFIPNYEPDDSIQVLFARIDDNNESDIYELDTISIASDFSFEESIKNSVEDTLYNDTRSTLPRYVDPKSISHSLFWIIAETTMWSDLSYLEEMQIMKGVDTFPDLFNNLSLFYASGRVPLSHQTYGQCDIEQLQNFLKSVWVCIKEIASESRFVVRAVSYEQWTNILNVFFHNMYVMMKDNDLMFKWVIFRGTFRNTMNSAYMEFFPGVFMPPPVALIDAPQKVANLPSTGGILEIIYQERRYWFEARHIMMFALESTKGFPFLKNKE